MSAFAVGDVNLPLAHVTEEKPRHLLTPLVWTGAEDLRGESWGRVERQMQETPSGLLRKPRSSNVRRFKAFVVLLAEIDAVTTDVQKGAELVCIGAHRVERIQAAIQPTSHAASCQYVHRISPFGM